jgi:hypothetical protein
LLSRRLELQFVSQPDLHTFERREAQLCTCSHIILKRRREGSLAPTGTRTHTFNLAKCCKYSDILSTPFLYAYLSHYTHSPHTQSLSLSIGCLVMILFLYIMHVINRPLWALALHTQHKHSAKNSLWEKKNARAHGFLSSHLRSLKHTRNFLRPYLRSICGEEENSAHVYFQAKIEHEPLFTCIHDRLHVKVTQEKKHSNTHSLTHTHGSSVRRFLFRPMINL